MCFPGKEALFSARVLKEPCFDRARARLVRTETLESEMRELRFAGWRGFTRVVGYVGLVCAVLGCAEETEESSNTSGSSVVLCGEGTELIDGVCEAVASEALEDASSEEGTRFGEKDGESADPLDEGDAAVSESSEDSGVADDSVEGDSALGDTADDGDTEEGEEPVDAEVNPLEDTETPDGSVEESDGESQEDGDLGDTESEEEDDTQGESDTEDTLDESTDTDENGDAESAEDSIASEEDSAADGTSESDAIEETVVECDPSGTWEVVVNSAALPGEGCQGGNPGQGEDTQILLVEKNPITGILLGTVIDPPAAGGVVQTLSVADTTDPVEGICSVRFVLTASIYLPPANEDEEGGNQVIEYDYTLVYGETLTGTGTGTVHVEFQTDSGAIELPCTEALAVSGTLTVNP